MIFVSNTIHLSPTRLSDAQAIVAHMRDREIADNTTSIPFPYTMEDATTWLEEDQIFEEENGLSKNLAIRNDTGLLIGSIGLHYNYGLETDKSEFGYWLAKPYWNNGIMTEVIKRFCEVVKAGYRLKKLEAHVFAQNTASQKVLLKAGFIQKELLLRFYTKHGKKIDAIKFVKVL